MSKVLRIVLQILLDQNLQPIGDVADVGVLPEEASHYDLLDLVVSGLNKYSLVGLAES